MATALEVLDWAAAQAAARHSPLHVVHVFTWPTAVDPFGLVAGTSHRACQEAAEQVLDEAVTRARLVAPERRITPRLTIGPKGRALLEQSQDASLLVLGHGSSRVRRLLRWSVDVQMVAHATCPVAWSAPSGSCRPVLSGQGRGGRRQLDAVERCNRLRVPRSGAARHRIDGHPRLEPARGRRSRRGDRRYWCRRGDRAAGT